MFTLTKLTSRSLDRPVTKILRKHPPYESKMKKLIVFLFLALFGIFLTIQPTYAITYEDDQLPVNLISNPHETKTWQDTGAQDYWLMYSNYNYYDNGLAVYFPAEDIDDDHLDYDVNVGMGIDYAGVLFYDSAYAIVDFIAFEDSDEYVTDVYGAWFTFITVEPDAVFFRVKMIYIGDSSFGSDMQAQALNSTLYASDLSQFMTILLESFTENNQGYYDGGYDDGYIDGQQDIYDNGSDFYNFDQSGSYDYIYGFEDGKDTNVNSGMTTFMNDLSTWIVPAIVLVILLGGFITIYANKHKGSE